MVCWLSLMIVTVMITPLGAIVVQEGVTENTEGVAEEKAAASVKVPVSQIVAVVPAVVCDVIVEAVFWTAATKVSSVEQLCGVACVVST